MRQRVRANRRALETLLRSPAASRAFTSNTTLASKSRPQLPFLAIPVTTPRRQVRYLTTETKQWLKHEGKLFVRYNLSFWGVLVCLGGITFLLNEEWTEKDFPTPHEWSIITRWKARGAHAQNWDGFVKKNRDLIIERCKAALERLEDPSIDGAGVRELLDDEPLTIEGLGKVGKDVSAKDENWIRGYYEVMMLMANTLEHVDGWVRDTTRNVVCDPAMVVGPSNPKPKPMPPGSPSAPREENCVTAFEPAENVYLRILTTRGFTTRQKMDAALAYAFFLDFKELPDAAGHAYDWALSLATESIDPSSPPLFDSRTLTINDKTSPPPENVLTALTAIATHKARRGDLTAALPMFVSLLRARRALSSTPPPGTKISTPGVPLTFWENLWKLAEAPKYPPPPPDGTQPPWRGPKELCEEAALQIYIGEIIYSSKEALRTREEGLAWTRDGVDVAEEQLRELGNTTSSPERTTCKECLSMGLRNWTAMVKNLAEKEEQDRKKREAGTVSKSTFGSFWSQSKPVETDGRWAAEEKVVWERIKRTNELLVEIAPPPVGIQNLFKA